MADLTGERIPSGAPRGNVFVHPQPYDLTAERELIRLLREVKGYLHTCRRDHHGTDWEGREYAMTAIDKILSGEVGVRIY